MNDNTLKIVLVALGIVAFLLIEGFKLIAKVLGYDIASNTKLKVALVISIVLGTIAGISSGQLQLTPLVEAVKNLPTEPGALIAALGILLKDLITFAGVVQAISQSVYAMLKEKLKENASLSFRL